MILILSNRLDEGAEMLFDSFNGAASLLTSRDLSRVGWELYLPDFRKSKLRLGNRDVKVEEIKGVISTMHSIPAYELVHIVETDREYVAKEMNASLAYLFQQLDCPMVNRPVIGSFWGTTWRKAQWCVAAAQAGFEVKKYVRSSHEKVESNIKQEEIDYTTIIGNNFLGNTQRVLCKQVKTMADAAGLKHLKVFHRSTEKGVEFIEAHPAPDCQDEELREGLVKYFRKKKHHDPYLVHTPR